MSFLEILSWTPWWVFGIVIYLILVNILCFDRSRGVTIVRITHFALYLLVRGLYVIAQEIAIIPLVITVLSLRSIIINYGMTAPIFGIWVLALILGIIIGWISFHRSVRMVDIYSAPFGTDSTLYFSVDQDSTELDVKESWYLFFLYLVFFILKYCIKFTYAFSPEMKTKSFFVMTDVMGSGVIPGIVLGRFLLIVRQFWLHHRK